MPTADVCRRHGVSSATFYKWKAKFGGLEVSDAKQLRQLEDDAKLKKLLAEAMLDNAMLKEITKKMVTPAARREAVAHLEELLEVSQRRACDVLGVDRTMVRYRRRRDDDAGIRERMRALAAERRRFGYRRLHWLLGREGVMINHKKFRRLYREELLQVRRRGGRKRALGESRADGDPAGAEPALVARLRVGCVRLSPPVPDLRRGRRLHPRVCPADRRHLDLGAAGGTGTGLGDRGAGTSGDGRQR